MSFTIRYNFGRLLSIFLLVATSSERKIVFIILSTLEKDQKRTHSMHTSTIDVITMY